MPARARPLTKDMRHALRAGSPDEWRSGDLVGTWARTMRGLADRGLAEFADVQGNAAPGGFKPARYRLTRAGVQAAAELGDADAG